MKWDRPQEPNSNTLTGNTFIFWMIQLYNTIKRMDLNYERITNIDSATVTAYTVLETDCFIKCDTTTASITLTLPAQADLSYSKKYIVRQIDASANTVIFAIADSAVINTAVTVPLTSQWATITLIADGTNWDGY